MRQCSAKFQWINRHQHEGSNHILNKMTWGLLITNIYYNWWWSQDTRVTCKAISRHQLYIILHIEWDTCMYSSLQSNENSGPKAMQAATLVFIIVIHTTIWKDSTSPKWNSMTIYLPRKSQMEHHLSFKRDRENWRILAYPAYQFQVVCSIDQRWINNNHFSSSYNKGSLKTNSWPLISL